MLLESRRTNFLHVVSAKLYIAPVYIKRCAGVATKAVIGFDTTGRLSLATECLCSLLPLWSIEATRQYAISGIGWKKIVVNATLMFHNLPIAATLHGDKKICQAILAQCCAYVESINHSRDVKAVVNPSFASHAHHWGDSPVAEREATLEWK